MCSLGRWNVVGPPPGRNGFQVKLKTDFETLDITPALRLYHRRTRRFKTSQLDLFLGFPLRPFHNTQVALLSRMLERGTMRRPSLRALNAYVDSLYGACFSSGVSKFGPRQVIHLNMELVSGRFTPGGSDQLRAGIGFLSEVLREPRMEEGGFPETSLNQEKAALRQAILSLHSDKLALARRRCLEEMCRSEPCGLPVLGNVVDFERIDAISLMNFHRNILTSSRLSLYVTDDQLLEEVAAICRAEFLWVTARDREPDVTAVADAEDFDAHQVGSEETRPHRISEFQQVQQGRIVLGYRTPPRFDRHYPTLLVLNQALGGDASSRLYRRLREGAGICYHAESFLDPSCGLLFVEASVDSRDCEAAITLMESEIAAIAAHSLAVSELEQSKLSLINRLETMDEDRSASVIFHYARDLDHASTSQSDLRQGLERVSNEDVGKVARQLVYDTKYTLQSDVHREPEDV